MFLLTMQPDFVTCGADFLNNSSDAYSKYVYNGTVKGALASDGPTLITVEGCRNLCGTGVAYYSYVSPSFLPLAQLTHHFTWKDSSATITTWLLPILGLIIQAPFESNQAWQTTLSICRWLGSPIAAMSYILWNIKVTGKCALTVDMSTRYNEYPKEGSDFSYMRDSLCILCIMNQYTPRLSLRPIEAERLIRLTLFSNMLPLNGSTSGSGLLEKRTELAQSFREGRKKGVVPVFISFLWFVFALALSIQFAYDDIGGNQTAHNLALGFLVGW